MKYSAIASFGISQSSMAGNETWSANAMIWSTLNQFALGGGYTKMNFQQGKLNQIHSYSITGAYLEGNYTLSTSAVVFWTKPYTINTKLSLSPQVFLINSPISYNSRTGETTVNRNFSFLVGSSFDYRISKRFGLSLNYRAMGSTESKSPILNNFLIGSRFIL